MAGTTLIKFGTYTDKLKPRLKQTILFSPKLRSVGRIMQVIPQETASFLNSLAENFVLTKMFTTKLSAFKLLPSKIIITHHTLTCLILSRVPAL